MHPPRSRCEADAPAAMGPAPARSESSRHGRGASACAGTSRWALVARKTPAACQCAGGVSESPRSLSWGKSAMEGLRVGQLDLHCRATPGVAGALPASCAAAKTGHLDPRVWTLTRNSEREAHFFFFCLVFGPYFIQYCHYTNWPIACCKLRWDNSPDGSFTSRRCGHFS